MLQRFLKYPRRMLSTAAAADVATALTPLSGLLLQSVPFCCSLITDWGVQREGGSAEVDEV